MNRFKRGLSFLLIQLLLLGALCSCSPGQTLNHDSYYDIRIGMTETEVRDAILVEGQSFIPPYVHIDRYYLYPDEEERVIVIRLDQKDQTVDQIKRFKAGEQERSTDDFKKIKEGMTLYEVIDCLGMPDIYYETAGMRLQFSVKGQGFLMITFDSNMKVIEKKHLID